MQGWDIRSSGAHGESKSMAPLKISSPTRHPHPGHAGFSRFFQEKQELQIFVCNLLIFAGWHNLSFIKTMHSTPSPQKINHLGLKTWAYGTPVCNLKWCPGKADLAKESPGLRPNADPDSGYLCSQGLACLAPHFLSVGDARTLSWRTGERPGERALPSMPAPGPFHSGLRQLTANMLHAATSTAAGAGWVGGGSPGPWPPVTLL